MSAVIGIRREDKSEWERRAPLTPSDVAGLARDQGLEIVVQASPRRVFDDAEYLAAGARVAATIDDADVVLAVKEIPSELLAPGKTYVFFAHVIKGQSYNMPMLARLLAQAATLIDYERITDDEGRRLIFFSLHAGYAGAIELLWALGRRLQALGVETPLLEVRRAHAYTSLADAKAHLATVGEQIRRRGLGRPEPLVIGLAGYGNVARGCHELLAQLGVPAVTPRQLLAGDLGTGPLVQVEFREEDMVQPVAPGAPFVLQEYYDRPERYRGTFGRFLPHLDALINSIYWNASYPRLVTKAWARETYGAGPRPRLQVIADISCDIEGAIEITVQTTQPDAPVFVWNPDTEQVQFGVVGDGPVIMAVDNLPCELPRESSEYFSAVLRGMVPALATCDFSRPYAELNLPPALKRAVIVHRGQLTADYRYLQEHLDACSSGS